MEIVEFEPRHAQAFQALNEAWISKYFVIEPKDREVLGDPQGKIIDKGGRVFMALKEGEPVGCAALLKMDDGGYEVAKMTVSETLRGSGLGRRRSCATSLAPASTPGPRWAPRGSIWRRTRASRRRWASIAPWASATSRRPRRPTSGPTSSWKGPTDAGVLSCE